VSAVELSVAWRFVVIKRGVIAIRQVAMAAAVVVTLVTGADYVARAVRLYRSPAPPGS